MRKKQQQAPERARRSAWNILVDWEAGKGSIEHLRNDLFQSKDISSRDRALVMEITQGVLRYRLTLEHLVEPLLTKPWKKLPSQVRILLLIGAYQIRFLTRIPSHAAVKETVEVIKGTQFKGFVPLVNAILRRLPKAVAPPLPDDPVLSASITTSTPVWLMIILADQLGLDEAVKLLTRMNEPPQLTLRVNTLATDRNTLLEKLDSLDITARPGDLAPTSVILEGSINPAQLALLQEGLCTVQDEGAQMIAPILGAKPGETILDACAAPGGKTTHLCQEITDRGTVIAVDRSIARMGMVSENIIRMNMSSAHLLTADLTAAPFAQGTFDRILVDAPCSGTGVLRRHPEGKWTKGEDFIDELAKLQLDMLTELSSKVRKGGRILYSTCSVLSEENEVIVEKFLETAPFRLIDIRNENSHLPESAITDRGYLRLWPHIHGCDGFFAALLERVN